LTDAIPFSCSLHMNHIINALLEILDFFTKFFYFYREAIEVSKLMSKSEAEDKETEKE